MPQPPPPTLVPIPLELLERNTSAMEHGVTELRAIRDQVVGEVTQARRLLDDIRTEMREHHRREEPALRAHEDYVRRLTEEESQAAAAAKAATTTAHAREEAARAEAWAKTLNLWTRVLIPLFVGLLGGGGLVSAYLGGPGGTP
jgi:hypothetical protein